MFECFGTDMVYLRIKIIMLHHAVSLLLVTIKLVYKTLRCYIAKSVYTCHVNYKHIRIMQLDIVPPSS